MVEYNLKNAVMGPPSPEVVRGRDEMTGHSVRPDVRERTLRNGVASAADRELLMLLLGHGVKGNPVSSLARQVLGVISRTAPEERIAALQKIDGMGPNRALIIAAALELGRRFHGHLAATVGKPADLVPLVQHYTLEPQEHFLSVLLNGAHEVVQIRVVAIGLVNRSMVHPREVFSDAVRERAAAIILCHNHPSGNSTPSQEDVDTTKSLLDASKYLGIPILDHLIVTKSGYFSFLEHQMLFE
jgi:DNA repair protein RadC